MVECLIGSSLGQRPKWHEEDKLYELEAATPIHAQRMYTKLRSLPNGERDLPPLELIWKGDSKFVRIVDLKDVVIGGDFHNHVLMVEGDAFLLRGKLRDCKIDWITNVHQKEGRNAWIRRDAADKDRAVADFVQMAEERGWEVGERVALYADQRIRK